MPQFYFRYALDSLMYSSLKPSNACIEQRKKSFIKIIPDILRKAHLTMSRALPTDIHRQTKI